MVKFLKYGAIAVLLLILAAVGFLLTLDVNQYKGDIVQAVKENTGRDFRIDGDLKLALSLIPTVTVEGVGFGNTAWGSQPDMVKVGRFEARVAVIPLFSGNVKIDKLILHDSEIFLETSKKGVGNWVLSGEPVSKTETASKNQTKVKTEQKVEAVTESQTEAKTTTETTAAGPTELPALGVEEIEIRNAKLSYKDGKSGKVETVIIPELTSKSEGWGSAMLVKLVAEYNQIPLDVNGTVGPLQLLVENKPYPIKAAITIGKATAQIEGDIQQPATMQGINLNLAFKAETLQDFNQFTEGELPAVAPFTMTATVSDDKGVYNLKSLKINMGATDLAGDVSITLAGKRPLVKAKLDSNRIDVTPFQSEEEQKSEKVFPNTPLPVAALMSVDADVQVHAKEVITRSATLYEVKLPLKLSKGRLQLSPLTAKVADGALSVNLDLVPVKSALQLNTDIKVKQLVPGKLPKLKEKIAIEEGRTDVVVKGKGTGKSVSEIMAGFNGQMLVQIGKGTIQSSMINFAGADLMTQTFSVLNPASEEGKATQLQCGVINFKIKDGMATADQGIGFETDKMTVVGSGTVNLKTEELDVGVRPYPREGVGVNAGKFTQMMRLGGTLAEPKAKVDTVGALKTAASTGAAVATLGLSLLAEGAYDRTTADEHPCDTALGKAPAPAATTTTQETQPTEEKPNIIESTGEKVKGVFKGLFGK